MAVTQPLSGSAEQPASHGVASGAAPPSRVFQQSTTAGTVPIIEVAYHDGKWWSLPRGLSQFCYECHERNMDAEFVWHWGEHRTETNQISKYQIDFVSMLQVNKNSNRIRSVRIAWVEPHQVNPRDSGAAQPALILHNLTTAGKVPIIELAHNNGMWWSLDAPESQRLYAAFERGENPQFTWSWGHHRAGSHAANGAATRGSNYQIDFHNMQLSDGRNVRIVWVEPDQVNARYSGELAS